MAHLDQFPLFRLATLLARQLSSPIANQLKVYARQHPRFGTTICARAGRWYRAGELRFKLWALRLAGPRFPISISDREAIDIGTDILGEAIIFLLGSLIIIFEVNRQAMNKEAKKLDKRSRWVAILTALEELKTELEIQQKEIDLLLAAIRELDADVPLPLPSTLTKPSHAPDTTDPAAIATPDQHASVTLPGAAPAGPPTSFLPAPTPHTLPDKTIPLPHEPPSSPAPHPPAVSPPASHSPAGDPPSRCPPDCKCNCKCGSSPPPPAPKPRCTK